MALRRCYSLITIMVLLQPSNNSRVIDSSVAKGLYVSDYCPFMKGCAKPGIHVMCLKNPNVIDWFGPHCHEAKNITVTDQIALRLLTIVNAFDIFHRIRRKVALGIEKGKDGRYFPRGYGIWRLEWDSELATFAQVWANQCLFHRDYCRSTDRFPNPSQSLGLVRFTYPDWKPITTSWPGTGFQPQIIVHAVIQTVKKWYTLKNVISVDDIDALPQTSVNKPYLNMVSSDVTHMGCGISAFTEYSYNTQNVDLLHNSVLLVCNFSSRLTAGTAVYNTTPPTTSDFSSKCGCPSGSKEDGDCLCYPAAEQQNCTGHQCNPTVVLLPIFTVEDAPPGKLPKTSNFQNVTRSRPESLEIYNLFENLDVFHNNSIKQESTAIGYKSLLYNEDLFGKDNQRDPTNITANTLDPDLKLTDRYYFRRRSTVAQTNVSTCSKSKPNFKYDVINPTKQVHGVNIGIRRKVINTKNDKNTRETVRNNSTHEISKTSTQEANIKDDTGNKLADLLNKLEQTVNHAEIDGTKKQLFDEKIKKIYGDILSRIQNDNKNAENLEINYPNSVRNKNEKRISDKYNVQSYHDSSYLEQSDPENQSYEKPNHITKTRKLITKTNEHIKRPVINSDQIKRYKDEKYVFKDRVVKSDALEWNRRMYFQKKLEELGKSMHSSYHKTPKYTNHIDKNQGISRRRPTIN